MGITRCLVVLPALLCLFGFSLTGRCAEPEPQQLVRSFYLWYFMKSQNTSEHPLHSDDMHAYVAADTLKRLRADLARGTLPGDMDYFLKAQDTLDDWPESLKVAEAIALGDGTVVVPVSFGVEEKISTIVFLKKVGGAFRIVKVDDTFPYN